MPSFFMGVFKCWIGMTGKYSYLEDELRNFCCSMAKKYVYQHNDELNNVKEC